MSAQMFDTLACYGTLREAGMAEEQAKAVTRVLQSAFEQARDAGEPVTGNDLKALRGEIREETAKSKTDLMKWMITLVFAVQTGVIIALIACLK